MRRRATNRAYAGLAAILFTLIAVVIFRFTVSVSDQKKTPPARSTVAVVRITKSGFEPATLTVNRGAKIIWTNTDQALHQVLANPYPKGSDLPSLRSELLNDQQTYEYTANVTGSFGYHDQLNPTINGSIIVR